MRGLSILSKVPIIVTLMDLASGVIFQNERSLRYERCTCVNRHSLSKWMVVVY